MLLAVYSAQIETNETNASNNLEKSSNTTAVSDTKSAASSNTQSYVAAPSFFSSGKNRLNFENTVELHLSGLIGTSGCPDYEYSG